MKNFPPPPGKGSSDGEERTAKLRKENIKALREREKSEAAAARKTRELRELRMARDARQKAENGDAAAKPGRKSGKR